jgi:hypothetical protein
MQEAIDTYFEGCEVEDGPKPTIAGLCYDLGFEDRHGLSDYGKFPEFSATVKKARLRVERFLEHRLFGQSVAGVIFNLKNNFGWKDQQSHEHTGPDGGPIVLWGSKPK